jgi:predicted phosphodiesterase
MLHRHNRSERKTSTFARLARTFVSMTFISLFVLSVTFGIKYLSETGPVGNLAFLNQYISEDSKFGQVAGALTKKLEENTINTQATDANSEILSEIPPSNADEDKNPDYTTKNPAVGTDPTSTANMTQVDIKVSVFADSHNDVTNLTKALSMSNDENITTILHLGDLTNLGITEDLQQTFSTLSSSGMTFYAIPGDRDLWKTSGPQNFLSVFGDNRHSFAIEDSKFVVFDNSMNFTKISQENIDWFYKEIADADFVFLSQPLYHPSNKVMGVFEGEEIINVKSQADELLSAIRASNVKAVFAAEHHLSSETVDPVDPELMHYVVGAITSTINERPQSILQSPRFSILTIKPDGTYTVIEKVL